LCCERQDLYSGSNHFGRFQLFEVMLMSPGALEEEAVSFVQNNCLAMFTLFWIESATLVDFHPPSLFIAAKSAPESDNIEAEDLRKQCPVYSCG
jgi:hypothetical protein